MIKKILLFIVLLIVIAYLTMALTTFNCKPVHQVCQRLELDIRDSVNAGFVTRDEIAVLLRKQGLYPIGKKMDDIRTDILEKKLNEHPLIEEAECYKTPNGSLCLEVTQRVPVLRVISNKGDNYYIDNKGKIMPPEANCVAHLAGVTGNVDKKFAQKVLYPFGMFLKENKFWDSQIEQINVTSDREIELVPRVGEHIVFLGKMDNFEEKLAKLKIFYEKALNQVGWNKYKRISLEFNNQIICTKKE